MNSSRDRDKILAHFIMVGKYLQQPLIVNVNGNVDVEKHSQVNKH